MSVRVHIESAAFAGSGVVMAATLRRDAADAIRSIAAEVPRLAVASLTGIGALTALSAWIGVTDDEAVGFARGFGLLCEWGSVFGLAAYFLGSLWCGRPTPGSLTLFTAIVSAAFSVPAINIVSFALVPVPGSGLAFYAIVAAIAGSVFFNRRMHREDRALLGSP